MVTISPFQKHHLSQVYKDHFRHLYRCLSCLFYRLYFLHRGHHCALCPFSLTAWHTQFVASPFSLGFSHHQPSVSASCRSTVHCYSRPALGLGLSLLWQPPQSESLVAMIVFNRLSGIFFKPSFRFFFTGVGLFLHIADIFNIKWL